MKKKLMFTLVSLSAMVLAGCGAATDSSTGSSEKECPSQEPVKVTEYVTVEVEKTFALTVPTSEDYGIALLDDVNADKVSAGSTVRFTVAVKDTLNKKLGDVKADGILKEADAEGVYSFVMPNHDVALEVSVLDTGAEELLVNPDVKEEDVPTGDVKLMANLTAAASLEGKYLSKATISDDSAKKNYEVVSGDGVSVTTVSDQESLADDNRPERSAKTVVQNGITDGYFYSIKTAPALGTYSNTGSVTETATTMKILGEDETDSGLRNTTDEATAKLASSTFFTGTSSSVSASDLGLANYVKNNVFTYNNYFVDRDKEVTDYSLTSKIAEDKKSYSVDVTWYHVNYSKSLYVYNSITTFDGLGFMTAEEFTYSTYAEGSYAADGKLYKVNDDAVASSVKKMAISATRGVKNDIAGLKDIHDYVLDDYNIHLQYTKPGQSTKTYYDAIDGTKVEMGGNFMFKAYADEAKAIAPSIAKMPDNDLFTVKSYTNIVANAKGTGTVVFDNGLGKLKEVPVEVIDAKPTAVNLTLDKNSIYTGDKAVLKVAVAPAAADQGFTLAVSEESTGKVTLAKNDDGSYDVTGVQAGDVILEATSTFDTSIKGKIDLKVMEKPTKEKVVANITTKTVFFDGQTYWGTSTYNKFHAACYINFEADGTGTIRFAQLSLSSPLHDASTFKWAIADDLTFTISDPSTSSKYLKSFEVVANDVFNCVYQGAYTPATLTSMTLIDRIEDLTKLTTDNLPK